MNQTVESAEILLKLENIHVHYGGVKALDGASVLIDEGEVIALMGPNEGDPKKLVSSEIMEKVFLGKM